MAIGIPGTIGGAAVMNAGAQGGCIAEILESVQIVSIDGEKQFTLKAKELQYSYRNSILQQENLVVSSVRLKLEPGHESQK